MLEFAVSRMHSWSSHHSKLSWELSHDLLLCRHWCQALVLLQPNRALFGTLSVAYSIWIPHTTAHHPATELRGKLSHDLLLYRHWCHSLVLLQPYRALFSTLSVAISIWIPHATSHCRGTTSPHHPTAHTTTELCGKLSHDLLLCHHWCQALVLLQPDCALFS